MKVHEVMTKDFHSLKPEDPVIEFISLMENENVHEALVIDSKGEVVGFVHYKILAQKNVQDPTKTKIESVMIHPPHVNKDEDFEKAVELLFQTGLRALPVFDENGKAIGIFTVFDAIKVLKNEKIVKNKTAEEVMSPAIVIHKDEDIGKARFLMREKNISRLPVVDDEDKLVGEVTIMDLLKAIQPKERISWYSMAAEKLTIMDIPVSTIMNNTPLTAEKNARLSEIIEKMLERGERGCIIVEDNSPLGVITTRDIIELWLASKKEEGVYVNYSGLEEEDEFVMETVDRIVSDAIRKIHSIYPVQYAHIHVKRYRKTGDRKLFSVRCRVMTDEGVFLSSAQAWDLRDAIGEAMDRLEKIVVKHKEKMETLHKPKGV
ncbi:MAG TPA: CBS domain-containing protein [Nanoarchaeota archaeon]|nr:CBS domain-containing protein [Nanoarchaeota archaeon]